MKFKVEIENRELGETCRLEDLSAGIDHPGKEDEREAKLEGSRFYQALWPAVLIEAYDSKWTFQIMRKAHRPLLHLSTVEMAFA